jgi:hypothetical protein
MNARPFTEPVFYLPRLSLPILYDAEIRAIKPSIAHHPEKRKSGLPVLPRRIECQREANSAKEMPHPSEQEGKQKPLAGSFIPQSR